MAKPQEKQAFPFPNTTTSTAPIIEHHQQGFDMDAGDDYPSATGCGCFRLFRFFRNGGTGEESSHLLNANPRDQDRQYHQRKENTWLEDKLKDVKGFSEVVAGPRWKNFIRKLGKLFHKKEKRTWQYDPYSYALNFDEGGEEGDEHLRNGYSSRFADPFSGDQERRPAVL